MVRVSHFFVVAVSCLAAVGCRAPRPDETAPAVPQRIVSLSPGLTETLFAVDAGDRVVGVTRYCSVPVWKTEVSEVGGYLDPNWEAIIALRPDLVLLMESQGDAEARAASLGLEALRVDQHDLASALESFEIVGRVCGNAEVGRRLRQQVESELREIRSRFEGRTKPSVLVVIGRDAGSGRVRSVWAAGAGTFLGDVIEFAGGENVLAENHVGAYPEVGREGLLRMDPDVILDVFPDLSERGLSAAVAVEDWRDFRNLRAVRDGRVHLLAEPFLTTPGPRIAAVVEVVARALHQEKEQ